MLLQTIQGCRTCGIRTSKVLFSYAVCSCKLQMLGRCAAPVLTAAPAAPGSCSGPGCAQSAPKLQISSTWHTHVRDDEPAHRSTRSAWLLFCPWLRSFWHDTAMPVGRCTTRTAESVVLTCCPPLPLALHVSMRRSVSAILTSTCAAQQRRQHTSAWFAVT